MKTVYWFGLISFFTLAFAFAANGRFADTANPPEGDKEQAKPIEPDNYDKLRVGRQDDSRTVLATNQILSPLGDQITFPSRPTAVALSPDRQWLGVLCHNKVLLLDLQSKEVKSSAAISGSFNGIVFSRDGKKLFSSSLKGVIEVYDVSDAVKLEASKPIQLPTAPKGKPPDPIPA